MTAAPNPPEIHPGRFLSGFVAPLRAVRFLLTRPLLWPFAAMPLGVNMVVLAALVFFFGPHASSWVDSTLPHEGWKIFLSIPLKLLAWMMVFFLGAVFVNFFGALIASPFNDLLSSRVEMLEGRLPPARVLTWGQAAARLGITVIDELKKWVVYLMVMALLVPLMIVPVWGHMAFSVLGFVVTAWFLGFEYLDYCFTRRHMHFPERRAFCWANKTAIVGLGSAITAASMIPFMGLVVMPFSVVGATLLYLDLVAPTLDQVTADKTE